MLSLFFLTEASGITTEVHKEKWPLRLAFADGHACLGDAHLANASCTSLGVAKTGFPGDAGTRKLVVLISYNGESDLLLMQLRDFFQKENWFLLGLDLVVLVAAVLVTLECVAALRRAKGAANDESVS